MDHYQELGMTAATVLSVGQRAKEILAQQDPEEPINNVNLSYLLGLCDGHLQAFALVLGPEWEEKMVKLSNLFGRDTKVGEPRECF